MDNEIVSMIISQQGICEGRSEANALHLIMNSMTVSRGVSTNKALAIEQ